MSQSVPDGAELSFSVTYKTGRRKILKVMSGTALADRLLQMAMDPDIKQREAKQAVGKASQKVPHTSEKALIQLRKNQLPQGRYIFGKDLPVGTFDFTWSMSERNMIMSINSVCMYNVRPELCGLLRGTLALKSQGRRSRKLICEERNSGPKTERELCRAVFTATA